MKTFTNDIIMKEENEDIVKLWEPLEFNIDEKYKYVQNGIIFSFFSNLLYYGIAFPILKIFTKIIYDLKIEGKENLRNLQSGAITVSNHVLFLDCAMIGLACGKKKIYYTTREGSFKIPVVRKLIKLLGAIPIPNSINNKKNFIEQIDQMLQNKKVIHFYPEAALWPYYTKIRKFKNGAFNFAIKNDVPVVPMTIIFREPKGIRKILKKKKDVTLIILPPIDGSEYIGNIKEKIEKLKEKVYKEMNEKVIIRSK